MVTPQGTAEPGVAPASIIERAAQRLDWTIAFGMRHSSPLGLKGTTNQQPQSGPSRVAQASRLSVSQAGLTRLPLISRLCLASVLVATMAGTAIFLLTRSAGEKATAESSSAQEARATASEATLSIGGLAVTPSAPGATQSATLAVQGRTPAALKWEAKPAFEILPSVEPPVLEPKAATNPAATTFEATSPITPASRNPPSETAFSAAEIAALLARGDWLLATGDVVSARLVYERAADAGVARAAMRLGETFDPVHSGLPHLRGLRADSGIAVFWYRRARDLGATGVDSRLKSLEAK